MKKVKFIVHGMSVTIEGWEEKVKMRDWNTIKMYVFHEHLDITGFNICGPISCCE